MNIKKYIAKIKKEKRITLFSRMLCTINILICVQVISLAALVYFIVRSPETVIERRNLWFFGGLFMECIFACVIYHWIIRPARRMEKMCRDFAESKIYNEIFEMECQPISGFFGVLRQFRHLVDLQDAVEISNRQAEYLALQNQINPHFLYNTLDAIRGDVICEEMYNIADAIEALSTFFRYTVTNVKYLVRLEDEIENILNYSIIQRYRFGNKLELKIIFKGNEEVLRTYKVPKLILQPIVENAIFHGLEPKINMGTIKVMIDETEQKLLMDIEDNGVGMSPDKVNELNDACEKVAVGGAEEKCGKGGIALRNVNRRIKLLFGAEYGLHVYSTEHVGTLVRITLPKVMKGEEYEKRSSSD